MITLLASLSLVFHIQVRSPIFDEIGMGACSAVYVSPTTALTAAHCVRGTTGRMWMRNYDGQSFTVTIIKKDRANDLCLLQLVNAPNHKYAKLGRPVNIGDKIFVMSNGEDIHFTYGEGIVQNVVIDPDTKVVTILHSSALTPGASGSGLFNKYGDLVGINVSREQGLSYAVDITTIEAFLEKRR